MYLYYWHLLVHCINNTHGVQSLSTFWKNFLKNKIQFLRQSQPKKKNSKYLKYNILVLPTLFGCEMTAIQTFNCIAIACAITC